MGAGRALAMRHAMTGADCNMSMSGCGTYYSVLSLAGSRSELGGCVLHK